MSVEGESYEQWLERTAPGKPVRTVDPRTWDWGVIVLLGLFFIWFGGARGWIGLALVVVLAAESVALRRMRPAGGIRRDRALRGATLLVTLALSGWVIWVDGGVSAVLPVLLVLLDPQDDRSFLRWSFVSLRRRSARPR